MLCWRHPDLRNLKMFVISEQTTLNSTILTLSECVVVLYGAHINEPLRL